MQPHCKGGPTSKPPVSSATLDSKQLKGARRSSLDWGPATWPAKSNRWDLTSSDPAQGSDQGPAQNQVPCMNMDRCSYDITQHTVESDNEMPPASTKEQHCHHHAFCDDESADDASHPSGHSNTLDSNGSAFRTCCQPTKPQGTLLHHFPLTSTSWSSSGESDTMHILHWL